MKLYIDTNTEDPVFKDHLNNRW